MDHDTFHLSEGRYVQNSDLNRNTMRLLPLGIFSIVFSIVIRSDLLLIVGAMLVVLCFAFRSSDVKKHAPVDFYPDHASVQPFRRPGGMLALKGMRFSRSDVTSVKIIRERIPGAAAEPKAGTPTGMIVTLRSGQAIPFVNRAPEEVLALDQYLRNVWRIAPGDPAIASSMVGSFFGRDLVNRPKERVKTVKLVLYGLMFGIIAIMLLLAVIVTVFFIFGVIAIFLVLLLLAVFGNIFMKNRKAYTGIKAITIKENGLIIHFGHDDSKFYAWDLIKYLAVFQVTEYLSAQDQNGYIILYDRRWVYFLNTEVADAVIAAYEYATGRTPPRKEKWGLTL